MLPRDTSPSPRTVSFTSAAAVTDADGIKTTIATAATAATYTGAALNGAYVDGTSHIATPAPAGHTGLAQYPCATASSSAGSYVASSAITFTGTYCGETVTRTATVVGTDGNATFIADGPVDTVTSITVAAQTNTSGAWTFGFTDLRCPVRQGKSYPWRRVRLAAAGNLTIGYEDGTQDTLAFGAGEKDDVLITRVVCSTTNQGFRLYW